MRWYRALTYKREQTGTDETRNPVFKLVETGNHILVRTPPWMPVLTRPRATASTWSSAHS